MLSQFVVLTFASFIGWQLFRSFLSFIPLNDRFAPVAAISVSYLISTVLMHSTLLMALAATGGVALLNKITDAASPPPITMPRIILPKFSPKTRKSKYKNSRLASDLPAKPITQPIKTRIPQL